MPVTRGRSTLAVHGLAALALCLGALPFQGVALAQDAAPAGVRISSEASVESLFKDFLHYARIGRFTAADAYAKALLEHKDLDPVEVMRLAKEDRKSLNTLLILIKNSTIGESATKVLELIEQGEQAQRQDADQIRYNIELLGGNPQQEFFARKRLAQSGEYAIPHMVQALLDPARRSLRPRIVSALPQIGREAVHPLVAALEMSDVDVKQDLIGALGEIGYAHAIPALRAIAIDDATTAESRASAAAAIARIESRTGQALIAAPDELFVWLANRFYNEDDAVRADPTLESANVWNWNASAGALERTVVPSRIFGQVMAMRNAARALQLREDNADAIALWLASNIRREGRLGMNVESGDPGETPVEVDETRPDVFPRALYFTQAAGPRYAHMVLDRAVADRDSAVALGAIAALRTTAGESSLVGSEDIKQPLVLALRFPDAVVRVRAALALGAALPRTGFDGAQYVVPVLAQTLGLTGRDRVLVVAGSGNDLNALTSDVQGAGTYEVSSNTDFFAGLAQLRAASDAPVGVFVSADVTNPGISEALRRMRSEFLFAKTPVVIVASAANRALADQIAAADPLVEVVMAGADGEQLAAALERARSRAGLSRLDSDLALSMALEAAEVLREIAADGLTTYDAGVAEPGLIGGLDAENEGLQIACSKVLALLPTSTAQRSIAAIALDDGRTKTLRLASLKALTASAKGMGNALEGGQVSNLIALVETESDLELRTAASHSLGALNLANNQASEIIRSYN